MHTVLVDMFTVNSSCMHACILATLSHILRHQTYLYQLKDEVARDGSAESTRTRFVGIIISTIHVHLYAFFLSSYTVFSRY
jgi:hypothetical protein